MSKPRLNDLDGKAWVQATKSVWMEGVSRAELSAAEQALDSGALLSEAPPRDPLKKRHPATFSERDVAKLITLFTREGALVLDPFLGTGSTALACLETGRRALGIELYPTWLAVARERCQAHPAYTPERVTLLEGDALEVMAGLEQESVDFIVTSPPYWSILEKQDHKARRERLAFDLPTDYGTHAADLGRVTEYGAFLAALQAHFAAYFRLLRPRAYVAIIVSDFRHRQRYYMFHADVGARLEQVGFVVQGLISLIQDNKQLYPYGYPTTYVPNIAQQFIVVARKL